MVVYKRVMFFLVFTLVLFCLTTASFSRQRPAVALDCYHNNEMAPHYAWSQTGNGGFSQLAGIILNLDADTISIKTALDSTALVNIDVLIIVDPDSTTETTTPKYLAASEITAVDTWVQAGGVLVLLANNLGNCALSHISDLSANFGIRFNPDTYGGGYYFSNLPAHDIFNGCDTIFIKDICTLTLTDSAKSVLSVNGTTIIATSRKGKGTIFALGDPWLYNEHIIDADNVAAGINVMTWLIAQVPSNTGVKESAIAIRPVRQQLLQEPVFDIRGRKIFSNRLDYLKYSSTHTGAGIYITRNKSSLSLGR